MRRTKMVTPVKYTAENADQTLLRTAVSEEGHFFIIGSELALNCFAWECFNTSILEHKEPFYHDSF